MEKNIKFKYNIGDEVFVISHYFDDNQDQYCYKANKKPTVIYDIVFRMNRDMFGKYQENIYYSFHTPYGSKGKYCDPMQTTEKYVFNNYEEAKKEAKRLNKDIGIS